MRLVAADHHAIAALQPPDAAGRAHIQIGDAVTMQLMGAADIVFEKAIAAIDDAVALVHQLAQCGDGLFGDPAGGQHDPDRTWRLQLLNQVFERSGAFRLSFGSVLQRLHGPCIGIEANHHVTGPHHPPADIGPHAAQSDNPQLHEVSSSALGRQPHYQSIWVP